MSPLLRPRHMLRHLPRSMGCPPRRFFPFLQPPFQPLPHRPLSLRALLPTTLAGLSQRVVCKTAATTWPLSLTPSPRHHLPRTQMSRHLRTPSPFSRLLIRPAATQTTREAVRPTVISLLEPLLTSFHPPGAQFIQLWNTTSNLQSVVLSYEVAFDSGFDFVKVSHRVYFWPLVANLGSSGRQAPRPARGPRCLGLLGRKTGRRQVLLQHSVRTRSLSLVNSKTIAYSLMWRTSGNGESTYT